MNTIVNFLSKVIGKSTLNLCHIIQILFPRLAISYLLISIANAFLQAFTVYSFFKVVEYSQIASTSVNVSHTQSSLLLGLVLFIIASTFAQIFLSLFSLKICALVGTKVGLSMLNSSYKSNEAINIDSLTRDLSKGSDVIALCVDELSQQIVSVLIVLAMIITSFNLSGLLIIYVGALVLLFYWFIHSISRNRIQRNARIIIEQNKSLFSSIRELVYTKDTFYLKGQNVRPFADRYCSIDESTRASIANTKFLQRLPKPLVESFTFLCIIFTTASLIIFTGSNEALASIAGLLLALQKLLPAVQKIYSSRTTISASSLYIKQAQTYLLESSDFSKGDIINPFNDYKLISSCRKSDMLTLDSFLSLSNGLITITGSSGVGKSTFLRRFAFYLKSSKNINLGFSDQFPYVINDSLDYNISLSSSPLFLDQNQLDLLSSASLTDIHSSIKLSSLSGGQKKIIGLLRAVNNVDKFLFLDEPLSGLDPKLSQLTILYLKHLSHSKVIVIVTHQQAMIEVSDHNYLLYRDEKD